ncbi:outer membrane beta-barrel protein [Porphyromonas loveana]|uniref:Opacity protein-like surface antigen n=1 Tax=Porphyromonas loveana TaxID=1884669 RepID=A0A2U1FHI7_9PORP|nr:outer membrane beta-barrel protein [Porphyromonas loveana]PVZ11627.1 opacity protein-like surface antigen [Porphyromonas loveana]
MRLLRITIALCLSLSFVTTLTAQDSKWWANIHVGREFFGHSAEELKRGWNGGIELRYYLSGSLYLLGTMNYGLASTSFSSGYYDDNGNNATARLKRHSILPAVGAGYEYLWGDYYSCYMQGGVGYGMECTTISYPNKETLWAKRFGWLLETGGDYFIRENLAMGVSVAHLRVGLRNNWTVNLKCSIPL